MAQTEESLRTAAGLRAELDNVLAGLAAEAGDCDPDDGWYPDTSGLDDLLDEVEDLACRGTGRRARTGRACRRPDQGRARRRELPDR